MAIQSVSNPNSTNFKSSRGQNVDLATAFVNMNDAQLMQLARTKEAYNSKTKKKENKSVSRIFWAIPVVDVLSKGILAGGTKYLAPGDVLKQTPLSPKVVAAGDAAVGWAGIIAVVGIYNAVKKSLKKNSETYSNFDNKNPVLSFMADIGVISAGMFGGYNLLNKFIGKKVEKNPEIIENGFKRLGGWMDKIDSGKLNQKYMPKILNHVDNFASKFPKAANVGKYILRNSVWAMLGLAVVKMMTNSAKETKRVNESFNDLKQTQLKTAKILANANALERDVLAQNQRMMRAELHDEMNKTSPDEID